MPWVADRAIAILLVGKAVPSVTLPDTATGVLFTGTAGTCVEVVRAGVRHPLPDACTFDTRGYLRFDVRVRSVAQLAERPVGITLPRACGGPPPVVVRDLAGACPEGRVPADVFTDVAGTTHATRIGCVAWWGIVRDVAETPFAPERPLTRTQLAAMVSRWLDAVGVDLPEPTTAVFADAGDPSTDTTSTGFRSPASSAASVTAGSVPGAPVARGQAATIVIRAVEHARDRELADPKFDVFRDHTDTAHEVAIGRAAEAGLVGGVAVSRHVSG